MENYGLLTFKETYILFDEKESSLANKQEIALVVAHECKGLILIFRCPFMVWKPGYNEILE